MKLHNKCSGECPVCLFDRSKCFPEDNRCTFTRANKDTLNNRLYNNNYTDKEKDAIRIWLQVQFGT